MVRKKDVSETAKARILAYLECGKTQKQAAEMCGISQQTVSRVAKNFDHDNLRSRRFGNKNKKKILTPRVERHLTKCVKANRSVTSRELQAGLRNFGVNVSESSVRRSLIKLGYNGRRPRAKPKLTDAMKAKRLAWAKKYEHWTEDDWLKVGFSDESIIRILEDRRHWIRRRPDEEFHQDCIRQKVKHPTSLMIWSVISGKGTGRLHIVTGNMNAEKYLDVIKTRLAPQLRDWYGSESPPDFIYMHDGAPCHKAIRITNALRDDLKLKVLDWPGNSPDMNPIENLWDMLKVKISKDNPTTRNALIVSLIKYWHRDESISAACETLIRSMPKRVAACVAAKGGQTKY